MAKTQYYTATSIDGFIADSDNSLEWLFAADRDGEAEQPFDAFFRDVGAFAMGATTYEWVRANDADSWTKYYGDLPAWVFTHRELPVIPGANVTFVQDDVRPVHAAMTAAAGDKNIWLVGGGELVGAFADAGLLDELLLGLAPVTLGGGAPLLHRRLTHGRLKLADMRQVGQFVQLTYEVTPPPD
jgi:dihydrofolate reductase